MFNYCVKRDVCCWFCSCVKLVFYCVLVNCCFSMALSLFSFSESCLVADSSSEILLSNCNLSYFSLLDYFVCSIIYFCSRATVVCKTMHWFWLSLLESTSCWCILNAYWLLAFREAISVRWVEIWFFRLLFYFLKFSTSECKIMLFSFNFLIYFYNAVLASLLFLYYSCS